MSAVLVETRDLRKTYVLSRGLFGKAHHLDALSDVNFDIRRGETLALVGESGCGKTTLGRCLARATAPSAGSIRYFQDDQETVDLATLSERALRPWRREVRMIFQDPYSSLNPRMSVFDIVAEPLRIHRLCRGSELEDRVAEQLRTVGLGPEAMRRYPHAFSGGQRQRIGIARALILRPKLIIADEAVSALDVSIQAQILNLLEELKQQFGLTYLFISHDLGVVNYVADRVAVMYLGNLVEVAPVDSLFMRPRHPYSELLLAAVPVPDPRQRQQRAAAPVKGEVPFLDERPSGCPFHTRCRFATDRCRSELPHLREINGTGTLAACHHAETIALKGLFGPDIDEDRVAAATNSASKRTTFSHADTLAEVR